VGGQARTNLARLNLDGTVDTGFKPGVGGAVFPYVRCVSMQPDGEILVAGSFTNIGGHISTNFARLNFDGTVDATFAGGANSNIYSVVLQADGKTLVGGEFTLLAGLQRAAIGRLNPDGTPDLTFNPGVARGDSYAASVSALAIESDGKVLVGGFFTTLAGQPSSCLGRLNNTRTATQSLTYDGSVIVWLRGGSSPEVWHVTFETSTNGSDWSLLGDGSRISGGWQLAANSLPTNSMVRARGYVNGAFDNSSDWLLEAYWGGLIFVGQPENSTNDFGTTAVFRTLAYGTGTLSYQWLKDGVPMVDSGRVQGATTPVLNVATVSGADAGNYSVRVCDNSGCQTSRVAMLVVTDPLITTAPQSQNRGTGEDATFNVAVAGTAPFNYQWYKGGSILAGATDTALTLTNLAPLDAGSYYVSVTGQYGGVTSAPALLTINISTMGSNFLAGADGPVDAFVIQPDGTMVMGGDFLSVGGQAHHCLARLNADGTPDPGFSADAESPGGYGPVVFSLAVQPDAKLLVGGYYTTLGGQARSCVARLNADGTVDAGFNPGLFDAGAFVIPVPYVYSVVLQKDGKILVGGAFSGVAGQSRWNLARLNPDGTLDPTFNPGAQTPSGQSEVYSLALQADGKILVGGSFALLGGVPCGNLGRLNADGSVDTSFNPDVTGYYDSVSALAVQADDKILVAGSFWRIGSVLTTNFARLNQDGTVDNTFNPNAGGVAVSSLARRADGNVFVGGSFSSLGGVPRTNLAELNLDGTPNALFSAAAEGNNYPTVESITIAADGSLFVGGWFTALNGQLCTDVGHVFITDTATQSLQYNGSTITWLRGGASPEVWRTTFEFTTNNFDWVSLGDGSRIPGGWRLQGVALLDPNGTIRARGYDANGMGSASGWFLQNYLAVPIVHPQIVLDNGNFGFRSNSFGFNMQGSPGQVIVIETSTNLTNWAPVSTNVMGSTAVYFNDPSSGRSGMRFYRLRVNQ
jgi:uncharacterized delta-60 repeat protein